MTRRLLIAAAASPLFAAAPTDLGRKELWCAADGSAFPDTSWKLNGATFQTIPNLETFQDIRTRGEWANFEFTFEWKMQEGGNSGVKYLIEKSDRWQPKGKQGFHIRARGHEFQLIDDDRHEDAKKGALKQCGSLYNTYPTVKKAPHKIGEWNQGKLVKNGRMVEHWVNGERLLRYTLERDYPATAISLQNHSDEVWFRSLALRGDSGQE